MNMSAFNFVLDIKETLDIIIKEEVNSDDDCATQENSSELTYQGIYLPVYKLFLYWISLLSRERNKCEIILFYTNTLLRLTTATSVEYQDNYINLTLDILPN